MDRNRKAAPCKEAANRNALVKHGHCSTSSLAFVTCFLLPFAVGYGIALTVSEKAAQAVVAASGMEVRS